MLLLAVLVNLYIKNYASTRQLTRDEAIGEIT